MVSIGGSAPFLPACFFCFHFFDGPTLRFFSFVFFFFCLSEAPCRSYVSCSFRAALGKGAVVLKDSVKKLVLIFKIRFYFGAMLGEFEAEIGFLTHTYWPSVV